MHAIGVGGEQELLLTGCWLLWNGQINKLKQIDIGS
jgi:hypothetical protein